MANHKLALDSISTLADALESGEKSAVSITESLINRYDELNEDINGYLALDKETALADAEASDKRRAAGEALSKFDGIPIAIKDNINVAGQQNTCASKILVGYKSTYDATVISKLKAKGFIPFGRTNMDEFAMGSSTENSAFAICKNPVNTDYVPGGSSGGSAAVVSAGMAVAALGSNTGGSIRQPAAFCGVVGFKPGYGRVSRYGLTAFASSLDQIGPITNTVKDSAILLDTIGGRDAMDCTSLDQPCGGFEDALANNDIAGMKVGLPREFFEVDGLDPETLKSIEDVKTKLTDAGAEIVDVSLPNLNHGVAVYYVICTAEASSNLSRFDGIRYGFRDQDKLNSLVDIYNKSRSTGFGDEVKRRIILGTYVLSSGYHDELYLRAQKIRTIIRNDFSECYKQCDVILGPVTPKSAFKIGEVESPLEMYLSDIYTIPVNLAGINGISVPVAQNADGLPISVQIIGDSMEEAKALKIANFIQEA